MPATLDLESKRRRTGPLGRHRSEPARDAGTEEVAATRLEVLPGDLPRWICHAYLPGAACRGPPSPHDALGVYSRSRHRPTERRDEARIDSNQYPENHEGATCQ